MSSTFLEAANTLSGLTLTPAHETQFDVLTRELIDWNERLNLTAITQPHEIAVRHYLDSLSLVPYLPADAKTVLDVGTGAGFPALPIAMVRPDLSVKAMEATAKKLMFIEHVADLLKLDNLRTLHARAEDAGQDSGHRAHFDVVTARAVARLPALLEYLLPLAKVGGVCIAMKGVTAQDEARDAQAAMQVLGGDLKEIVEIHLPEVEEPHYLVIVEKTRKTPSQYPRKAGTPTKTPL